MPEDGQGCVTAWRSAVRRSSSIQFGKPFREPCAGHKTMKPISNTAFYCCGIRMRDAESQHPVCGDQFAKLFMNEEGMRIFERFAGERGPNRSNVARARYIDDLLRARLAWDPPPGVVRRGCVFASPAFGLGVGGGSEPNNPAPTSKKDGRLPPE